MLSRRTLLAASVALPFAGPAGAAAAPGLGTLAARRGRYFGTSLASTEIVADDPSFALMEAQCSVWVPAWEMKWGALCGRLGDAPDYRGADKVVAAAIERGKRLRGHTLVWHEHLPEGAEALQTAADWDRHVVPHVAATAGHFGEAVFEWDVVNEAIEPSQGDDGMRRTPFYAMRGPDYVADAFRLAAEAAPHARLCLNDDHLYYAEGWQEARRVAMLRLIDRLLGAGVPLHVLGLQCHLDTRWRFEERRFARFVDEVTGMGLDLTVTELDVTEAPGAGAAGLAARRRRAADEVGKVLDVLTDRPAFSGVVTWGLSDDRSWLRKGRKLVDNQGLPYDDAGRPTPMRDRLATLLSSGRSHHDRTR